VQVSVLTREQLFTAERRLQATDLLGDAPEWQEQSLCSQTDPDAFFPEKGGSTREAKRVCLRCPVRVECLGYALDHDERFGIWGGLSERERRKLKRSTPAAVRVRRCDAGDVNLTDSEVQRFKSKFAQDDSGAWSWTGSRSKIGAAWFGVYRGNHTRRVPVGVLLRFAPSPLAEGAW
jgi:WhiB family transcriptional regulator, redox-sensing transcriptional regulator